MSTCPYGQSQQPTKPVASGCPVNHSGGPAQPTPDLAPWPKFAIVMAFVSFVLPIVGSIVGIAAGTVAKVQLKKTNENKLNRGVATIAQVTSLITLALYGGFLIYARQRWAA